MARRSQCAPRGRAMWAACLQQTFPRSFNPAGEKEGEKQSPAPGARGGALPREPGRRRSGALVEKKKSSPATAAAGREKKNGQDCGVNCKES